MTTYYLQRTIDSHTVLVWNGEIWTRNQFAKSFASREAAERFRDEQFPKIAKRISAIPFRK